MEPVVVRGEIMKVTIDRKTGKEISCELTGEECKLDYGPLCKMILDDLKAQHENKTLGGEERGGSDEVVSNVEAKEAG